MRITKIVIKNLFGIKEMSLGGKSIELTGPKGSSKTSVLDSIRYALTNNSERDFIVKKGESEGEILIETDTGLSINRKKRTTQSDYKMVTDSGKTIQKPESFISEIFTPLSIDPVRFTQMTRQEQNRAILDLIVFPWDLKWINEQFGEIPSGVNYEQNILKVLSDIQADNGQYFLSRQDINRDIKSKQSVIDNISKDIPSDYDYEKWYGINLSEKYRELEKIKDENNKIQRAKTFKDSYENKKRGLDSEKMIEIASIEKAIQGEKTNLTASIERMKAEILAAESKIKNLSGSLEDKTKLAEAEYQAKLTKLDADFGIADDYASREIKDVSDLNEEITTTEAMKTHLNEYKRMVDMKKEITDLKLKSEALTVKIDRARNLPSEILKDAKIPVKGLTVNDGIPLINGLPISNLSDGEKLELCVDITISNSSGLSIVLLDGTEKLDEVSRNSLYAKCKEKGIQVIATRTTNDNELIVTEL
jgi:exonuclease SbcC